MKKMYKQPTTDIMAFQTEYMMDSSTMSPGGPGTGQMEAPRPRSVAPAVPGTGL